MHTPLASAAPATALGKKRLITCFDFTSNMRDHGANVLHHYERTLDRVDTAPVPRKKYYVTGVGTGLPEYG